MEELGSLEVEKALNEFSKETEWDVGTPLKRDGEDEGVVVRRENVAEDQNGEGVKASRKRTAVASTPKPKKKRKKGSNAIDDIFG